MTEIWDIARYVEEHPEDYEQRWRLAKKLYTAWEYRLALEHLQVLRNEWQRKLNVVRYLAATYYRLGRYAEAITELESGIEVWPQEVGLREQLARVLEIAGQHIAAAEVWEKIAGMDQHHPIAANAAKRLRTKPEEKPEDDLKLTDSDSGIDLSPGRVCPNCGAQNSDEFSRCWQCHAPLIAEQSTPWPTPAVEERRMPVLTPETGNLIVGLVTLGLFVLSFYLTLRLLLGEMDETAPKEIVTTLWGLYTGELARSRVITGLAFACAWPVSLWIMLIAVKASHINGMLVNLTGLLLAALTYVGSWLPANMLVLAALLPMAVSLAILAGGFGLNATRTAFVWLGHLAIMLVVGILAFTISESVQLKQFFNPASEVPAVISYIRSQSQLETPGQYHVPGETAPLAQQVKWTSTGSAWLDRRAGDTVFVVYTDTDDSGLRFELNQGETEPRVLEPITGRQWKCIFPVNANEPYFVKILGDEGKAASIVIEGMLVPQFIN